MARTLLELPPVGGHGRIWHHVLVELAQRVEIVATPQRGIGRRLRRGGPQVLLADGHEWLPQAPVPVVAYVHEAGWFTPELRAVLDPEFLAHIEPRTLAAMRAADQVIVPSRAVRADLIRELSVPEWCVHAVPHGIDPIFRPGLAGGRELVAAAAGRDRGVPYVLYAATLHPRKNLGALRTAIAQLAGEGLPHLLVIAGHAAPDRRSSAELEAAAAAELPGAPGRVVRVGEPNDRELAALMGGAAAFCLPSLYEGFGLTALEALACGSPVVVSDRGALPEVVADAALVVAPQPGEIAAALRRILGDPDLAARLAAAGPRRAAEFSWERMADGWWEILRGAAASPYTRRL